MSSSNCCFLTCLENSAVATGLEKVSFHSNPKERQCQRMFKLPHSCTYLMRNTGLDEAQAGIKIAGRNINNLRYTDDTTLMAESEEELKSLLMKVKEESEKVGLKHNIQKTEIMASGPITSWQIQRKQWKQCQTLYFWAPKSLQMVTAAMKLKDTYSLEGKL